jgi:hypothetical protein
MLRFLRQKMIWCSLEEEIYDDTELVCSCTHTHTHGALVPVLFKALDYVRENIRLDIQTTDDIMHIRIAT